MASGRNHKLIRKMFTEPMNQVRTRESDIPLYPEESSLSSVRIIQKKNFRIFSIHFELDVGDYF